MPNDDALHGAMVRGRVAVEQYFMEMAEALGEPVWSEVEATGRLRLATRPEARFVPFSSNQEGGTKERTGVGADWLWWWISPTGVCFGLLVQAKNLRRRSAGWSVDFDYRNRRQIVDLLEASDVLQVPAAYALYCGPPNYRSDLTCGPSHSGDTSDRCNRSGVCILPALMANDLVQLSAFDTSGQAAVDAYQWAVPLEDLVNPRIGPHTVRDLNLPIVNEDLRRFLTEPQPLPLSIAKKIFAMVSRLRQVRFSIAAPELRESATEAVLFRDLPVDVGHFGVPYFEHVLRGLRLNPPAYVAEVAAGGPAPAWLKDRVAGIVLVDVS